MRRPSPPRKEVAAAALAFVVAVIALAILHAHSTPQYRISGAQAIAAARADPTVHDFLAGSGPTRARSIPLDSELRRVTFFAGPRIVYDAAVDARGVVRYHQPHSGAGPDSGARLANSPWILGLLCALFVLATAVVPVRRLRNLDVLALLSFVATVVLLNARLVFASAAVAVVPLTYLAVRCLRVGLGPPRPPRPATPLYGWLTRRWSAPRRRRMLVQVTAAGALAFLMITLTSSGESDVAASSLSGATNLLHGRIPYGHIVEGVLHGDTYPLLTYVLYIPGALWTPVTDAFSDLSGSLAVAAAAALIAATGLRRLARAQAHGDDAERDLAGVGAMLAWLAFPPVLLASSGGSNDMVLAAVLVWALALAGTAGRSTLLLAAAAWVKLVPLALAPLWLARLRGRELVRGLALAGAVSIVLCMWLVLLGGAGAVGEMVHGLSFQFERGSFHAPWRSFGLQGLQVVVQAGLLAAVLYSALRARRDSGLREDPVRLAAVVAGILLWVQIAANYWTWAYLPWVFPFVWLALLAGSSTPRPEPETAATR